MVALTKEPVFITKPMRFGKYKGKTIQELALEDTGYLRWMIENMQNLDEDTRYTIRKVLESNWFMMICSHFSDQVWSQNNDRKEDSRLKIKTTIKL